MTGLSRADRFTPSPRVRFREIGGEAVLLDLDRGEYFSLNETGTAAWGGLAAGRTLGEVHAELLARFEVEEEVLWRDLEALVGDLLDQGLLVPGVPG